MKKGILFTVITLAILLTGCTALQNAYQMTKCQYSYNSVSGIKVAGIDFSNISAASLIMAIPKITNLIKGNFTELPLEMTVNVNVKNPDTQKTAALADMRYQLNIDGLDVASGSLGKKFEVGPQKTDVLPVVVKTDLCNVLMSDNRNTIVQIVKNFTGISGQESTIKLKVKPVLLTNKGTTVTLAEVPVSFKYGKKKN